MSETENAILITLRSLETSAAQRGNVVPLLSELDRLTRTLPPGSNPDLLHYLHKRSYEKARLLLEGLDPESGACPR
jgi:hypothetical protein